MTAWTWAKTQISRRLINPTMKVGLRSMISTVQHVAAIFPHNDKDSTYTLPAYPEAVQDPSRSRFAIPPKVFRVGYCTSDETYLASGRDDTTTMRSLLRESVVSIEQSGSILELGVAGGRLIRHLADLTETQEIWGVDCWSSAILWCKEHLSPPFHFATTTVTPHLPFEDRAFGLVFAGSVWTHIGDVAGGFELEVRRILRPEGRFYFTINDRSAVKFFQGGCSAEDRKRYIERIQPDGWVSWLGFLETNPGYHRFARGEAQMVTMGRSTKAHVLWDVDYLIKRLGPGWQVCSVTP